MTSTSRPARRGRLKLTTWLGLRDALIGAFAGVLEYAAAQVPRAQRSPAKAVHEFRKSVRRARSLLRLIRDFVPSADYTRIDRDLRDALGGASGLRDADVLLGTLRGLVVPTPELPAARAASRLLRAQLAALRSRKAAPRVLRSGAAKLRGVVDQLSAALPTALSDERLARGLSRLFRRAERALERAREEREEDAIHDWRKRVKEVRYALELLTPPTDAGKLPLHQLAADLAEQLGEITDLIILARFLRAAEKELAPVSAAGLVQSIHREVQRRFTPAARIGVKLHRDPPKALARAAIAAARGPASPLASPGPSALPMASPRPSASPAPDSPSDAQG